MERRGAVMAVALAILSCRDAAFERAAKVDTAAAWRAYLAKEPDGMQADEGRDRLVQAELAAAQAAHTVAAYKRFIDEFGSTPEAQTARALLEGLRFNAALKSGTGQAWRTFLRDHPDGAHQAEASAKLQAVESKEVLGEATLTTLESEAKAHPDDERGEQARARFDDATWQEAQGPEAWFAYLRQFPAGRHRAQAQAAVDNAEFAKAMADGDFAGVRALVRKRAAAAPVEWERAVKRAEADAGLLKTLDKGLVPALVEHWLRPVDELVGALKTHDPFERWEAALDLSAVTKPAVIAPLLEAATQGRFFLVRRRAFESLRALLDRLPVALRDYEWARRLEASRTTEGDSEQALALAVLADAMGDSEGALRRYRDLSVGRGDIDAFLVWRAMHLRAGQHQAFSVALAGAQLATWARSQLQGSADFDGASTLTQARTLCGMVDALADAQALVSQSRGAPTEFPEDVEAFAVRVREARRLSEARLQDVERKLVEGNPQVMLCAAHPVIDRLGESEAGRRVVLPRLLANKSAAARLAISKVASFDPAPDLRAQAQAALEAYAGATKKK